MQQKQRQGPFDHHKDKTQNNLNNANSQLQSESDSDNEIQKQQPKQQPSIQFKDSPIQMKCPFCLQNIRTEVILKPQFISILLGFALFFMFPNFFTLVLTMIILQLTSTRKHRCPLCQRELGSDGKFLVFFDDEIYSFALGTNGIIISKKILTSIALGIVIFIILSVKVNNAYADVTFTDLTWPQFARQCPYESTSEKCNRSNQGLTVKNWRGFVMRVQDNRNTIKRHFQHAVSLYIKMNDQSSPTINKQQPDLFLTVTSYQAHQWEQNLNKLSHGDEIMFNATFEALRNTRNIPVGRHLNMIDFNFTSIHNAEIHVYMSHEEDLWFFQKLSGEKLRKHQNEGTQSVEQKQVEKEVEKQLNKALDNNADLTQKQKQVIEDANQNNAKPQPKI